MSVVFNPPYNSLRRLGQDAVVVDPAPAAVVSAPSGMIEPSLNYDKPIVTLSSAGIVIGGLVLVGLAFSLSNAVSSRK